MIQQPELGKKIAAYRKEKGLTQAELVEQCNLSVRTLQRIEAGDVTPRPYTVRLIFEVLELSYDKFPRSNKGDRGILKLWLEQFYIHFIDLFNLKTHTMRKISILSGALFLIIFGLTSIIGEVNAQADSRVKQIIKKNNTDFINWFNKGEIDSLTELYRNDACLVSRGCGKDFIRRYYTAESQKFKFTKLDIERIEVEDSVAIERGQWSAVFQSGQTLGGAYLSVWRLTEGQWLIESESSGISLK